MKSIKMLILMFVLGIFMIGCTVTQNRQPMTAGMAANTNLPATTTLLIAPQVTATVLETVTPQPTFTATPLPDWIVNFAEPLLQLIANRPSTYQDDFSNPGSGWYNGSTTGHPDVLILGEKRYVNGEYRVVANGATAENPAVCSGVEDQNVGSYGDFVAEFDVRFASEPGKNHQDWQIQFHRNNGGHYFLALSREGEMNFSKCVAGVDQCPGMASYSGEPIKGDDNWNHIQLIVQGIQMAAYVNGVPTLYVKDTTAVSEFKQGYFSVNACNFDPAPLETNWDNFQVWDISSLP